MKSLILFFILSISFLVGFAQVPNTMSFQGNLTDPGTGNPIADGNYELIFALFDASVDGNIEWAETHSSLPVVNGLFNVILGSINPLSESLFSQPLYLQINVAGEDLTSRIELASAPYSLVAKSVIGETNTFTSAGSVGIGTTSPGNLMNIVGSFGSFNFHPYFSEGPNQSTLLGTVTGTSLYPQIRFNNDTSSSFMDMGLASGNKFVIENGLDQVMMAVTQGGNLLVSDTAIAEAFKYKTPAIKYYSISPTAFQRQGSTITYDLIDGTYGTYRYASGGVAGSYAYVFAPVNLPHNSKITDIKFYIYDNDATWPVETYLMRAAHGATYTILSSATSTVDLTSVQTLNHTTFTDPVINNQLYSYYVLVGLNQGGTANTRVYSVAFAYETKGP